MTSNRTKIITSDGVEHTIATKYLYGCNLFTHNILEVARDLRTNPIRLPIIKEDQWTEFSQCLKLEYTKKNDRKRERQEEATEQLHERLQKKPTLYKVLTAANYLDHAQLVDLGTSHWSEQEFNAKKEYRLPNEIKHMIAVKTLQSTLFDQELPEWVANGTAIKPKKVKVEAYPWSCCTSHAGDITVTGNTDGTLSIWCDTDLPPYVFQAHTGPVSDLRFSPDDRLLVSVAGNNTIAFWDATEGFVLSHALPAPDNTSFVCSFNPDGSTLAANSPEGIDLWQMATRTKNTIAFDQGHEVRSLAFTHNGNLLAAGGHGESVKLWDPIQRTCITTIPDLIGCVTRLAFNNNDTLLAIGTQYGLLQIYDIEKGHICMNLLDHSSVIWGLAFSHDSRFLYSGSVDKTIRIWDLATCKCIKKLKHAQALNDMRLTPHGTLIAACGNKKLYEWPVRRFIDRYQENKKYIARDVTLPQANLIKQALETPAGTIIDIRQGKNRKAFLGFPRVMQAMFARELPIIVESQQKRSLKLTHAKKRKL